MTKNCSRSLISFITFSAICARWPSSLSSWKNVSASAMLSSTIVGSAVSLINTLRASIFKRVPSQLLQGLLEMYFASSSRTELDSVSR
ncbi:Uncharacterised protein [Vibrio cholerae]|nr:Uncharacterised protein [Vibrio cholerae]